MDLQSQKSRSSILEFGISGVGFIRVSRFWISNYPSVEGFRCYFASNLGQILYRNLDLWDYKYGSPRIELWVLVIEQIWIFWKIQICSKDPDLLKSGSSDDNNTGNNFQRYDHLRRVGPDWLTKSDVLWHIKLAKIGQKSRIFERTDVWKRSSGTFYPELFTTGTQPHGPLNSSNGSLYRYTMDHEAIQAGYNHSGLSLSGPRSAMTGLPIWVSQSISSVTITRPQVSVRRNSPNGFREHFSKNPHPQYSSIGHLCKLK